MNASAESDNTGVDSGTATNGKYGGAMTLIGNSMNDGLETDSDRGKTSSAISSNIKITTTSNQDISNVNRDTSNTNQQVRMGDLDGLAQDADEEALAGKVAFDVFKHELDTIKRKQLMGIENQKVYAIKSDCAESDLSKCPRVEADPNKLKRGADGKVVVVTNGITNTLDEAVKNGLQNARADENGKPRELPEEIYLVYSEKTDGMFGGLFTEPLTAVYQKFFEGDLLGLTDAGEMVKALMKRYGSSGLVIDGHSRGTLTIGNAMESLYFDKNGGGAGSTSNMNVHMFGSAQNVEAADRWLEKLQGRDANDPNKWNNQVIQYQGHKDDWVGTLLGGNPATGGTTGDSGLFGVNSPHNSYGGCEFKQCKQYWADSPNGKPLFKPARPFPTKK